MCIDVQRNRERSIKKMTIIKSANNKKPVVGNKVVMVFQRLDDFLSLKTDNLP